MDYWTNRMVKSQQTLTSKNIRDTEKQLKKYYKITLEETLGQFEETYNKLLLSIKEDRAITPADLYKLDKYWEMQGQLAQRLQELGDKETILLSKKFVEQYQGIYSGIALHGSSAFGTVDDKAATQFINQIWCADGKSWSQRVWDNTEELQQTLNDNLINCVVTGKKTTQLKSSLTFQFNVSYHRAETVVRTEMAHIQTQAAKQRYEDAGITEVEVLVDPDERTCPLCSKLDGKKYPIGAVMPVPAHPNCRCCIVPVVKKINFP